MNARLLLFLVMFVMATGVVAQTVTNEEKAVCYPLYQEAGAVPLTQSCPLDASLADTNLGNYYCTATPAIVDAYCGDLCYSAYVQLEDSAAATHPGVDVFVRQQSCIAKKSCLTKTDLEDSSWLDSVVPDFIAPFAEQQGDWSGIIQQCDDLINNAIQLGNTNMVNMARLKCANDAAKYHIQNDLLAALKTNGCGTENDWEKIAQQIIDCVKNNDLLNWFPASVIAKAQVVRERDEVRAQCLASQNNTA